MDLDALGIMKLEVIMTKSSCPMEKSVNEGEGSPSPYGQIVYQDKKRQA